MALNKKFVYYFFLIIIALPVLLGFFSFAFETAYSYKIYPGVFVGGFELGGMTKTQAIECLTDKTDSIIANGLNFTYQDKRVNIDAVIAGNGDVFEEIFFYRPRDTVNLAYEFGHVGNWSQRISEQFSGIIYKKNIPIILSFNEESLRTILADNFKELERPAANAELEITVNSDLDFKVKKEQVGQTFDYKKATFDAKNNLINLENKNIELTAVKDEPKIATEEIEQLIPKVREILDLSPIIFVYNDKNWNLDKKNFADWLKSEKVGNKVDLAINQIEAEKFLDTIAAEVNVEALNGKFEIVNSRVSQFQSSQPGLKLNITKTIQAISNKIIEEKINTIDLVVDKIEPQIQNSDVNDLGIVELLGRGISDFSGSPKNRIHNITNGAKTLNGILIKPDEIFSLLTALGEINGESGYLPELVIKGNKTTPEFGGGLCQIGTTTFRVALQSGLPIVERRNHSYNVSYYGPTGTDATIYGPKPDMRFINDTGKHILFLTKIEGTKLIFEFWGTKDGRKIKFVGKNETDDFTKFTPIIYNIVKPGPAKYVETDSLEPGKKKLLERSHNGADAKFDYIITYPDGREEQQTFSSHYVPWREVWLMGAEKKLEDVVENNAIDQSKTNITNNE